MICFSVLVFINYSRFWSVYDVGVFRNSYWALVHAGTLHAIHLHQNRHEVLRPTIVGLFMCIYVCMLVCVFVWFCLYVYVHSCVCACLIFPSNHLQFINKYLCSLPLLRQSGGCSKIKIKIQFRIQMYKIQIVTFQQNYSKPCRLIK